MSVSLIATAVVLTLFAVLTSSISAVVGMAGGIMLLSFMTLFLKFSDIVPIHGVVQLVSNSSRAFLLKDNIRWPFFFWYLAGLPIGTTFSALTISNMTSDNWAKLLVAGLIFYVIFKPKKLPGLVIPAWGFFFVGFVAGWLGLLIGATGPLIAPFFIREDFTKQNIIATKASVQMTGHLAKIPAFIYLSFDYMQFMVLIVAMSLASIVGTKLGVSVLEKIPKQLFIRIFKTALFLAAIKLVYDSLVAV